MSGLIDIRQLWANGLATLVRGERHWHFLTTPLTSTAWDGDARSTEARTLIDLSAVFGVPAGVKAVLVRVIAQDAGSAGATAHFALAPSGGGSDSFMLRLTGLPNSYWGEALVTCPCDENGDIYYGISASGAGTMEVYLQIWGWLY